MTAPLPERRVDVWTLRRIFNSSGYLRRAQPGGDLQQVVLRDGHPTSPLAGEPVCTRSQFISYRDRNRQEVARVHQYLRPDGTIGLSGRPDPKLVVYQGVRYVLG